MKLFKNYFALVLLALIAFTSCSSVEEEDLTEIEQLSASSWTLSEAVETNSGTDVFSAAGTQILTLNSSDLATASTYTVSGALVGGPRPNYGDNGNAGSWSVSDHTITFTPTDGTASTATYTATSADGAALYNHLILTFTSTKNSTAYTFTYTR